MDSILLTAIGVLIAAAIIVAVVKDPARPRSGPLTDTEAACLAPDLSEAALARMGCKRFVNPH